MISADKENVAGSGSTIVPVNNYFYMTTIFSFDV